MDLGACIQIETLEKIMTDNGIYVPRLRGLRLMKDEEPLSREYFDKKVRFVWLFNCDQACRSNFVMNANWAEYSSETNKIAKKYLIHNSDYEYIDVNWSAVHGKKRKLFKYYYRKAKKAVTDNFTIFNKYCGRSDVLYIHARIGGLNWDSYDGPEIAKQPWFLEKVDDGFDNTYCDIYAKIKEVE